MENTLPQPMSIQLSEQAADFVRAQLASGRHASAAEVIEDLIRDLGDRVTHEDIDAELVKGLNSGVAIEITPEYWEAKRRSFQDWFQRNYAK